MRRPPIACQRAVQSLQSSALQHIWVPDDVLSLAAHRFFRSTCQHQKRHGSNVPGPLEARKRAAKRRMTASASFHPYDSLPTSFSLGALFGYRAEPPSSWRYEPPSLPKGPPPSDTSSPIWDSAQLGDLQPRSRANNLNAIDSDLSQPFAQPNSAQQLVDTQDQRLNLEAIGPDPTSSHAIENAPDNDGEYERCVASFRTRIAAKEDGRHGQLVKDAFMQHLPSEATVWRYCVAVLEHTVFQLGCNPTPVLQCMLERDGHLLRSVDLSKTVDDCARLLDCLESLSEARHVHRSSLTRRLYGRLALLATETERSTSEAYDDVLLRLIKHTGHSVVSKASKAPASVTNLLHALAANLIESADNKLLISYLAKSEHAQRAIVSTINSVAAAPERFTSAERALLHMPRSQLLALIPAITLHFAYQIKGKRSFAESSQSRSMNVWLRLLQQVEAKEGTGKTMLEAAMVPLAKALSFYNTPAAWIPQEVLLRAMLLHQNLDVQFSSSTNKRPRFQALLADVLLQIQARPSAYRSLLDTVLPLVAHHAGLGLLLRCIRTMEEHKLPLSTTMNFQALITKELEGLRSRVESSSESRLQERAFTLQACEKLVKVLSRMGHALPATMDEVVDLAGVRQFDNLLSNARANHALPIACRVATEDLPLMERVAMVHQLAYHYSQDTTRTHREVWRSIYYLYNYLASHSLPIGPLFTKAIVHASIIRPLSDKRFVSARRLIWVCHLVARVEGDEVAAQVENHFHTWRGDLIGHAKRIYIGVGGNKHGKAHVSTMKRLGLL